MKRTFTTDHWWQTASASGDYPAIALALPDAATGPNPGQANCALTVSWDEPEPPKASHQCTEMIDSEGEWKYQMGQDGWELWRAGNFYEAARGNHPHCQWCGKPLNEPESVTNLHQSCETCRLGPNCGHYPYTPDVLCLQWEPKSAPDLPCETCRDCLDDCGHTPVPGEPCRLWIPTPDWLREAAPERIICCLTCEHEHHDEEVDHCHECKEHSGWAAKSLPALTKRQAAILEAVSQWLRQLATAMEMQDD